MKNNKNKKPKLTDAERTVLRWTGVEPDGKKPTLPAEDLKTAWQIVNILSKDPVYAANPELAFGIVRRCMTGNVLKSKHFEKFMTTHPVFVELNMVALESGTMEIGDSDLENNKDTLLERALLTPWGRKNKPYRSMRVQGKVPITYVAKDGVKTELVSLGWEMIRYATDSRPYIALDCGGGSAIDWFLLRTGRRPDYRINNDASSRRWTQRGTTVAQATEIATEVSESETDSIMEQLLAGNTVTLGL